MSAALTWLNDLAQWIGRWFPRIVLVHPTHQGVRFGPKGSARAVGPGIVMYWPLIHDLIQVPITTISYQTCAQTLSLDAAGLIPEIAVIATAVQFKVTDAIKAAVNALNFHAIVDNRVRASISKFWKRDLGDRSWLEAARAEATTALVPYGIELQHLDITDLGRGCVLKNLSDWSYSDSPGGKRPTE